mmetsp:Transcript_2513/g.2904  ORF Transcript_2513/g.2904 Transcript_2513/m.2904 type:complete len:188 (+) Transcript_2513:295-858(+)
MVLRGFLDLLIQELPTQSPTQSTRVEAVDMAVEGTLVRDPSGGGGRGGTGDSVVGTRNFLRFFRIGQFTGGGSPDGRTTGSGGRRARDWRPSGDLVSTNVHISTAAAAFQHFFLDFGKPTSDDNNKVDASDNMNPFYLTKLRGIHTLDGSTIPINCQDFSFHFPPVPLKSYPCKYANSLTVPPSSYP